MSRITHNIIANFLGKISAGLMTIIFVPFYIKFLGVEAYGLIGFFAALTGILGVLDLGLSTTINRELAIYVAKPDEAQTIQNLVRTLEIVYWGIAVVIGLALVGAAPVIAHHWLQAGHIAPGVVQQALLIMGLVVLLQWPISLYTGGLMGLQHQVCLNVIVAGFGFARSIGAVLVLWLLSPTIQAFFLWQIIITALYVYVIRIALWRRLPPGQRRPSFDKNQIKRIWRFAAGVSGYTALALILTQMDKVILSRLLPLEHFAYYMLATNAADALIFFIYPVYSAFFPIFSELASAGNTGDLRGMYHKGSQLTAVMLIPVATVLFFFSEDLLSLWLHNPKISHAAYLILSILVVGRVLAGLMQMPAGLLLSYGKTKFIFFTNLVAIIVLTPLIVYLTVSYGALGGASAGVILNLSYLLFIPWIMHQELLPGEAKAWFLQDIGLPLVSVVTVVGLGCLLVSRTPSLPVLLGISLAAQATACFISPASRLWLRQAVRWR